MHVLGDRRDHFETSTDIWELFKLIVEGRRQREIEPTLTVLRDCLTNPEIANESRETEQRIRDTLRSFVETLTTPDDAAAQARYSDEGARHRREDQPDGQAQAVKERTRRARQPARFWGRYFCLYRNNCNRG